MHRSACLFLSMMMFATLVAPAGAQSVPSEFPIKADDGSAVANMGVPTELASAIEQLPGVVVIGEPRGDVTLAEFYDLNCPFCRKAAPEIAEIIHADKRLRLILVPFPVLSVASIEAARVEGALAQRATPGQFYTFHHNIYASRGVVNGARALAVAGELGFDPAKLTDAANADDVTEAMKARVRLGNKLGLVATPSFVIKNVAVLGYPGRHAVEHIIESVRQCGNVVC
jgi:protein-disulfide isomerase